MAILVQIYPIDARLCIAADQWLSQVEDPVRAYCHIRTNSCRCQEILTLPTLRSRGQNKEPGPTWSLVLPSVDGCSLAVKFSAIRTRPWCQYIVRRLGSSTARVYHFLDKVACPMILAQAAW